MAAFKRALSDLAENVARMRTQLREIEIASEGQMQSTAQGAGGARRRLRPARVRPLHAHAGAHALPRRVARRRDHPAAGPAEEPRRDRARDPPAGAPQPRAAAGPDGRAPGAAGQPRRPLLSRGAPDREGARTRRRTSSSRASRVELDRSVLEKITAPFEHLLRNAVAHGIETPEARAARGQARDRRDRRSTPCSAATRWCSPSRTTAAASTTRASASSAVERGPARRRATSFAEALLAQFIFWPGFSTADRGHARSPAAASAWTW